MIFLILMVALLFAVFPAATAVTTELTITKYASDGKTILNQTTKHYSWLEANLPVKGDGVTHYFHQGPTFNDSDPYDPAESQNVLSRDWGAVKGTDVKDLCELVGGMHPGDSVTIKASDGLTLTYPYEYVYTPDPRQGPMVVCWYNGNESQGETQGIGYPGDYPAYFKGMRLIMFADTSTNIWHHHVFGNYDMLQVWAPQYRYNFSGIWPTSGGISEYNVRFINFTSREFVIVWGPYITNTTTDSTKIHVKTAVPTTVTVEYATEEYYRTHSAYDRSTSDGMSGELHTVPLSGLASGTTYHYKVSYGTGSSGDFHFSTFPNGGGSFSFIVYGDTRDQLPLYNQSMRHELVADRIAVAEPDALFVLHTGDLVTLGDNSSDWNRFFSAGRAMLGNTTFFPALGNHEDNASLYYDAFGLPPNYTFRCGDVRVSVLNSNDWAWSELDSQAAWLAGTLSGNETWKFVTLHHPIYTSEHNHWGGWENLRSAFEPVLDANGADAVFCAHIHVYERDLENGVMYVTEGRGGAPSYRLDSLKIPGYQSSLEYNLGYTRVTIDATSGTARFEVKKVADISPVNGSVTAVYPADTVFETFILPLRPPPVAAFAADRTEGMTPLTVNFTDESTDSPTAWSWDVDNDGTIEHNTQNATHTYPVGGLYTVNLTVSNPWGSSSEVKTGYINVTQAPPPHPGSITPAKHRHNGKVFAATILGTGFQPDIAGTSVILTRGTKTIAAKTVDATSESSLTCSFRIPKNAKTGLYSVTVKNPDGQQATVARMFKVIT